MSRSLKDLLHLLEQIAQAGASFRSLTEAVETTTSAGRMLIQMVGSFAEFARAMIRERTQAGLAAARARGHTGGRRPKLQPDQQQALVELVHTGQKTQADVARLFRVHPATVSRLLAAQRMPPPIAPPVATAASRRGAVTNTKHSVASRGDASRFPVVIEK